MNCPKCNKEVKLIHQQYWCSKCFIGFTRTINLEEFSAELALRQHLIVSTKQMINEKTGLELLDYVLENLMVSLYPDPFHLIDCLTIAKNKLVNKNE